MLTPQVPVAKEGYPFIGFAVFSTMVLALLGLPAATAISFVAATFILCFFRDPERFVPAGDDAIVSPADGKVISVEKVQENPFTATEAHKISIFMNVFNVHVNRNPCGGRVEKVVHKPGKFYSADSARGALENEYCATVISTPHGRTLAVVQIAGLIARRIVCWLEPGDDVTRGSRFGLIRFGSRVDLYLPLETEVLVNKGDKVRAGETILGYLQ
jgi:phosphatidylserine decarboxylase